jgi:hypothetical protein
MNVTDRWFECPSDASRIFCETAQYTLTENDIEAIASGGVTEIHEFVSRAGKEFRASLTWNKQDHKVAMVFPAPKPSVEGVLCPDHFVELRMSEKRYFCPTKIDNEDWCPVGMWRNHAGHEIEPAELEQLLLGLTVGPWMLTRRSGDTYEVMATYDFGEHKLTTSLVESSPGGDGVRAASEFEAFDDTAY